MFVKRPILWKTEFHSTVHRHSSKSSQTIKLSCDLTACFCDVTKPQHIYIHYPPKFGITYYRDVIFYINNFNSEDINTLNQTTKRQLTSLHFTDLFIVQVYKLWVIMTNISESFYAFIFFHTAFTLLKAVTPNFEFSPAHSH